MVAPVFAVQPSNQNIIANDPASFTARASGFPAYQWQASTDGIAPFANLANGGIFSGVTTDTLQLTNVPIEFSGYVFRCVATNTGGTATSNTATLTVAAPANRPYILTDPDDVTTIDGGNASFGVTAAGTAPLVYQWQVSTDGGGTTWINVLNAMPYSGSQTNTLTVNPAPLSFNGYRYRCRVRNAFGQIFSNNAALSIAAYTWTPPNINPIDGETLLQLTDTYGALWCTIPPTGASVLGQLVAGVLSVDAITPPDDAGCFPGISLYFSAAGVHNFSVAVSVVGAQTPGPFTNFIALYAMDGVTLIDSSTGGTDGPWSGILSLNVPAPGQYILAGDGLRNITAGSKARMIMSYTLQPGDAAALVV